MAQQCSVAPLPALLKTAMPYKKHKSTKYQEAQLIAKVMENAIEETEMLVMKYVALNFHEPWYLPGMDLSQNIVLFHLAQEEMEKLGVTIVVEGGRTHSRSIEDNPQKKFHANSGELYTFAETAQFVSERGGSLAFSINMWKTQMTIAKNYPGSNQGHDHTAPALLNHHQDHCSNKHEEHTRSRKRKEEPDQPEKEPPVVRYLKISEGPPCQKYGNSTYDNPEGNLLGEVIISSNEHKWSPSVTISFRTRSF